jgi:hypothetical protein
MVTNGKKVGLVCKIVLRISVKVQFLVRHLQEYVSRWGGGSVDDVDCCMCVYVLLSQMRGIYMSTVVD